MEKFADAFKSKSVRARFFFTFAANSVRFALSFLAGVFVARALGPGDFGNFNFLLASFTSIAQLLDMGTSHAFYTFLSRRKRGRSFYAYYAGWVALQFVMTFLLVTVLLPEGIREKIWLGHGGGIVVLALLASFGMNQLWQVVSLAGESIRATATVQAFNVVLAAVHMLAVLLLLRLNALTVSSLFVFIALEYVFFAALLASRLKPGLIDAESKEERLGDVLNEFASYSHPLLVASVVGFLYAFADNWLLQRFGGSVEQGFYSVGFRFTFLGSIATTSMLQVFWKEIAEASERRDNETVKSLYMKTTRILYFSSAVLSCFLIPFSRELLVWLLGPSYEAGWLCLAIMLLYPMPQALGQVRATAFLGLGLTAAYRNYGLAVAVVSIPLTYVALAPSDAWGLNLASTGLALKTVVMTFGGVNVLGYMLSRAMGTSIDFWYQLAVVAILLPCAYASKLIAGWFLSAALSAISTQTLLISSMVLYLPAVAFVVYAAPRLTGLKKEEMVSLIERIKSALGTGL